MRAIAVGCGLALVAMAGLLALSWLFATAVAGAAGADNAVLTGSATWLALLFGGALVYIGARGGVASSHRRLGPSVPVIGLVAFLGVLVLGSLTVAAGPAATAGALPGLHFLGALLPALAVVGLAALPHGGMPWRHALAGLAYGGCAATLIALLIEGALVVLLLVALLTGPGGAALADAVNALVTQAQAGTLDAGELTAALTPLITPATIAAVFLLMGVLGPLTEELAKGLGVALADPPSPDRAWLWGVAVGAGFGVTEALIFGAMGIGLPSWPVNLAVRAIATLMHATMGGLAGLGVYYLLAGGRRRRGVALLGLAWIGHAAWNSGVLLAALAGIVAAAGGPGWSAVVASLAGLAMLALFLVVVLVFARQSVAAAALAAPGPGPDGPPPGGAGDAEAPGADARADLDPPADAPVDDTPPDDHAAPPDDDVASAPSVGDEADAPPDDTAADAPPEDPAASPPQAPFDDDAPDPRDGIPGLGVDLTWRPPEPGAP